MITMHENAKRKVLSSVNNKVMLLTIIVNFYLLSNLKSYLYLLHSLGELQVILTSKLYRVQSKVIRAILQAPWYVSNSTLYSDSSMLYVREEIRRFLAKYITKLESHPNHLAANLLYYSKARLLIARGNKFQKLTMNVVFC